MNTRNALTLGTLVLMLAAFAGCKNTVANFTAISTYQIPLEVERRGHVNVQSTRHIFLIFPIGHEADLTEVIDEALERRNADLLLDARVDFKTFYIPFIYGVDHYEVEGEAASTR